MNDAAISQMERGLDVKPYDWELRVILADAYEEAGRDELARFLRFTAKVHKCPLTAGMMTEDWGYGWRWYREGTDRDPAYPIVGGYWELIVKHQPGGRTNKPFATRKEAEEAFRAALEDNKWVWPI